MSDTPEHIKIVDAACDDYFGKVLNVNVSGTVFTLGEISALAGDFYQNPDELKSTYTNPATGESKTQSSLAKEFLTKEADIIRKLAPTSDLRNVLFRGVHYLNLAIENQTHFQLGEPEGARITCANYHKRAREMSASQDVLTEKMRAEILLHEGFALHFLVDLFSSGHMRTPRGALEKYFVALWGKEKTKNAQVVASLLSMRAHNVDNEKGVYCEWRGSGDATKKSWQEDSRKAVKEPDHYLNPHSAEGASPVTVIAPYYGDDHIAAYWTNSDGSRSEDTSASYDHIKRSVASQIIDAFPTYTKSEWSRPIEGRTIRCLSYDVPDPYERFLQESLPKVKHNHEHNRSFLQVAIGSDGRASWRGDTTFKVLNGMVEMEVHSSNNVITRARLRLVPHWARFIADQQTMAFRTKNHKWDALVKMKGFDFLEGEDPAVASLFEFIESVVMAVGKLQDSTALLNDPSVLRGATGFMSGGL